VKKDNTKILAKRNRKITKRLERKQWKNQLKPMFTASNIHYEMDGRHQGIACGGIGAIHLMNKNSGLVEEIDSVLHLLKRHLPYHESDHVLNIAYNVIAGGTRLEDIELQRQDEAWLDALGAEIIPDPTTAGDFLRRFSEEDIIELMEAANTTRRKANRIEDLKIPPGNHLEALKGDRSGQHSIRINDQWRICFDWTDVGAENVEIVDYH